MNNKVKYIFNTKFACDEDKNGQLCEVVEDLHNGQLIIKFENGTTLKVYDTEIQRVFYIKK